GMDRSKEYPDEMLKSGDPVGMVAGRWTGDRIVVAGDYADEGHLVPKDLLALWVKEERGAKFYTKGYQDKAPTLYAIADCYFEDISLLALRAIAEDRWVREDISRTWSSDPETRAAVREILGEEKPKNGSALRPDMIVGASNQLLDSPD
ncbi:hypothetical protein LCGC14_2391540, partial [marine sediment metagenome]